MRWLDQCSVVRIEATLYRGTGGGLDGLERGTSRTVLITEFWTKSKGAIIFEAFFKLIFFPPDLFILLRHSPQIYTFAMRLLFLGSGCLVLSKGSKGCGYQSGREFHSGKASLFFRWVGGNITGIDHGRRFLSFQGRLFSWRNCLVSKYLTRLFDYCLSLAVLD